MNDFTKKELETFERLLDDDINDESGYSYVTNYHDKLHEKIKSLIENYCEHESASQDRETLCFFRCDKCRVVVDDEGE